MVFQYIKNLDQRFITKIADLDCVDDAKAQFLTLFTNATDELVPIIVKIVMDHWGRG